MSGDDTCGDRYGDLVCDGPPRHGSPHSAYVGRGKFVYWDSAGRPALPFRPRIAPDILALLDAAEAEALAAHRAGTCQLSEWSCSHCERES